MKKLISLKEKDPKEFEKLRQESRKPTRRITAEMAKKSAEMIIKASRSVYCEHCEGINPVQEKVLIDSEYIVCENDKPLSNINGLCGNIEIKDFPKLRNYTIRTYKCPRCGSQHKESPFHLYD